MKYTFRGYSKSAEKWVYGYLLKDNIILDNTMAYIVEPNSVGLCSDLYDYTFKIIYEHDILKIDGEYWKVYFSWGVFTAENIDTNQAFPLVDLLLDNRVEVIGNTYEV